MSIVVGVGVVVENQGKVLLGQKKQGIWAGYWSLPGGKIELFEDVITCGLRELEEETGLTSSDRPSIISISNDVKVDLNFHSITFGIALPTYYGELTNKEPDKFQSWAWFELDQMPDKLFLPSASVLAAFLSEKEKAFSQVGERYIKQTKVRFCESSW